MTVSRSEFLNTFGATRLIDSLTEKAYKKWEYDIGNDPSPHGQLWHTSFHGSQFPGDDPKACGRKALYSLLDAPRGPVEPKGRAIMEAGKAIEVQIVERWHNAGLLLSAPPTDKVQTGFTDEEVWLTCSVDSVLLLVKRNRPHVVEIKSKDEAVILDMQKGKRSYDEEHRRQVLIEIALAHKFSKKLWPEYEPVIDGSLYYVSRSRPRNTKEYFFEYDEAFMEEGYAKLAEWKQAFLAQELPVRDSEWSWTSQPCRWCPYKKNFCKPDLREGVESLTDSKAWDEMAYKRVIDRWLR